MAPTAKTVLPEESELIVQELNVSWPVLQTASVYIGKAEWCNNVSCNLTKQPETPAGIYVVQTRGARPTSLSQ